LLLKTAAPELAAPWGRRRPAERMADTSSDSVIPERPTALPDDKAFWTIYEKGETIGRGHFAKVKLVRHRASGGFFAAKILDKMLEEHQEDYESMMREFKVLRSLHHKNIVNLQDAYETPTSLILVCELATGGELMHRIAEENDVYTEDEVKRHLVVMLQAIRYMHENGVVHRDLKPENILLSDKTEDAHILIADFGLGRFVKSLGQKMETVCGTHHYLAPELVRCDRGEINSYDRSVDVWGVGLIAFIMLFGFNPFLRESNMQTHQAILDCRYTFPKEDNVSSEAKDLIKKMICLDPSKRISIEEAMGHPWFSRRKPDDVEGLSVGGSNVREMMKEFNRRRAALKLTNLRARGRSNSIVEGVDPAGMGPIAALKNFVGGRRGSVNEDAIKTDAEKATVKSKFSRRRNSSASEHIQEAAASNRGSPSVRDSERGSERGK
jgi:calcium/calmodulin-dependent protein kinase I